MITDRDNHVLYQETLLSQNMRQSVERDIKAWNKSLPELIAKENALKDKLTKLCGESGHDWGTETIQDVRAGTQEVLVKSAWVNFDGEGNDIPAEYGYENTYKKVKVKVCKCCAFKSVVDAKLKITEEYV